jgi:hypothetical protein
MLGRTSAPNLDVSLIRALLTTRALLTKRALLTRVFLRKSTPASAAVRCLARWTSVPISRRAHPSRAAISRCVSPRIVQLSSFSVRASSCPSARRRSIRRLLGIGGAIPVSTVEGTQRWFLASSLKATRRVTEATHARGSLTAVRCCTKAIRTSCATSSGDKSEGQRRVASRRARSHRSLRSGSSSLAAAVMAIRPRLGGATLSRPPRQCTRRRDGPVWRPCDGRSARGRRPAGHRKAGVPA